MRAPVPQAVRPVLVARVAEITRLKAGDGGPMDIGGAPLAGAAMRAGLIDEYVLAAAPVLVGGSTRCFTALDKWVHLDLVQTRPFPVVWS